MKRKSEKTLIQNQKTSDSDVVLRIDHGMSDYSTYTLVQGKLGMRVIALQHLPFGPFVKDSGGFRCIHRHSGKMTVCGKVRNTLYSLQRHIKKAHNGPRH